MRGKRVIGATLVLTLVAPACGSQEEKNKAACAIGIKALEIGLDAFHRTQSIAEIVGYASPAAQVGCESQLRAWQSNPNQAVTFQVETADGSAFDMTRSLNQLKVLAPPTTTPFTLSPAIERFLDCRSAYDFKVLVDLCVDGSIEP